MSIRKSAEAIDAEAARWAWRTDVGGDPASIDAELEKWLAEDSRHAGALLRAEAALALLDESARPIRTAVVPIRRGRRLWLGRTYSRRSVAGAAGVGACAASVVAALLLLAPEGERWQTQVGEIRRMALADRSAVAINTASDVEVDYERDARRVTLRKGEAWFQVAKNKARPFVVEAGRVRVQAVGTAFSVRRRENGVDVLVTEGVVRAWRVGAEKEAIRIEAGAKGFLFDNATVVKTVAQSSEIDRKLAWRGGKIDLAGETLAAAVSEFNRYNVRQIEVVDQEVGSKRLYGVFRIDDPEGFARAASLSLGVRAFSTTGNDIAISRSRNKKFHGP